MQARVEEQRRYCRASSPSASAVGFFDHTHTRKSCDLHHIVRGPEGAQEGGPRRTLQPPRPCVAGVAFAGGTRGSGTPATTPLAISDAFREAPSNRAQPPLSCGYA